MLLFPLKVAHISEAITKGAIILLIRMRGVGIKQKKNKTKKKIQDPLLPEKKIARIRVNAAVCFVK